MTTGGTVVRSSRPTSSTTPRWIDDRRIVEHLPSVIAVLIFAACFMRIRQRWFIRGLSGFGYDTWVVQSTIDGRAIAPNQYRPLMPWVDHLLSVSTGLPLPSAILAVDLALLVVTVVLLQRLCRRLGAPALMLAAAGAWAFWVAKLDHWHPEVMVLTVIVTAAALCLLAPRPSAWWLMALGLLACGARTDYAAGLGLVVLAVGIRQRRTPLVVAGLAVGGAAIGSTVLLARVLYPQAAYQVAVVQLPFNLTVGSLAMVVLFYGTVLVAPALLAVRHYALPPLWPVLAWFLVQFAVTFVVGRVEESRIFMPFAPVLAVAAVLAWRRMALDAPTDTADPSAVLDVAPGGRHGP